MNVILNLKANSNCKTKNFVVKVQRSATEMMLLDGKRYILLIFCSAFIIFTASRNSGDKKSGRCCSVAMVTSVPKKSFSQPLAQRVWAQMGCDNSILNIGLSAILITDMNKPKTHSPSQVTILHPLSMCS